MGGLEAVGGVQCKISGGQRGVAAGERTFTNSLCYGEAGGGLLWGVRVPYSFVLIAGQPRLTWVTLNPPGFPGSSSWPP